MMRDEPRSAHSPNTRVISLPRLGLWMAAAIAILSCGKGEPENLETSFRTFFDTYVQEIEQRNTEYLVGVHPDLPSDMHEFFLDATEAMMRYAGEQGLEPTIECKEYSVCRVTWPQPGGSWAAQSFVRHEGVWRFLPG